MTRIALSLLLLFPVSLFAREITPDEAAIAAQNWLQRSPRPFGTTLSPRESGHPNVRTATDENGRKLFHMVAVEDGTIITSADDELPPVIAFTESKEIPETVGNPLWAILTSGARSRMETLEARRAGKEGIRSLSPSAAQNPAPEEWASLLDPSCPTVRPLGNGLDTLSDVRVGPLVKSKWSQRGEKRPDGIRPHLYDYYTPSNYVCGCVATATAQVMRYHSFPTNPVAPATTLCKVDGRPEMRTTLGGTYAWDRMPWEPPVDSAEEIRQAIGKLCHDVGVAVGMMWSKDGSGAYGSSPVYALKEVFGYANAVCYFWPDFSNIPDVTIARIIRSNLDAKLPVLISIRDHEVVGDGYGYQKGALYVHINMGWGGKCDAWFHLPEVDCDAYKSSTFDIVCYNISPSHTGALLTGRATNTAGVPMAGVRVDAVSRSGTISVQTDEKGIYAIWVEPDRVYRVVASNATSSSEALLVQVPEAISRHFEFSETEGRWLLSPIPARFGNSSGNDLVLGSAERAPCSLSISGPDFIASGATGAFTCTGRYDDGTTASLPAVWTVSGPASIHESGELVAGNVTTSVLATVHAEFKGARVEKGVMIVPRLPNDDFAGAIGLSGICGAVDATNIGATQEAEEPSHCGERGADTSVWWQWSAPETLEATFSTAGSFLEDTAIGVYTGTDLASLEQVACNDDISKDVFTSRCSFTARKGTTYYIAVSGFFGETGGLHLEFSTTSELTGPPENDDFADAAALTGSSGVVESDNRKATRETGEPWHAGLTGYTSVWWKWTVPFAGQATLSLIGSDFDTLMPLAVYTQNAVPSLNLIVDNWWDGILLPQVSFPAIEGTTYYIAVSGYKYTVGDIVLRYSLVDPLAPLPVTIGGDPAHPLHPGDGPGVSVEGGVFTVRFRAPEAGRTYLLEASVSLEKPFHDTGAAVKSKKVDELIEFKAASPLGPSCFFRIRAE